MHGTAGMYVFKVNPADTLRLKQEQRTQIATNMQILSFTGIQTYANIAAVKRNMQMFRR